MHLCFINLKMYIRVEKETTVSHVKRLYIMGATIFLKKKKTNKMEASPLRRARYFHIVLRPVNFLFSSEPCYCLSQMKKHCFANQTRLSNGQVLKKNV